MKRKTKFSIHRHNENGYKNFSLPKAEEGMALDDKDWMYGNSGGSHMDFGDYSSAVDDTQNPGRKPKMSGFSNPSSGISLGASAGIGAMTSAIGNIPGETFDPNTKNGGYFNTLQNKQSNENQALDTFSKAAAAIPVYGWAASAGAQIIKGANRLSKDKYGIYKSKFSGAIDNNINPLTGVKNIVDLVKHPTASGVLNQATFGLFGRNRSQEEAKREKTIMENKNAVSDVFSTEAQGNVARNMVNGYQSPAYGRKGMKLSKYSKNC